MKSVKTAIVLTVAGLLSACGGGGGGGGSTSSAPTATLSGANIDVTAQDATTAAFMPIKGSQSLTGAQVLDESVLFGVARAELDKLPTYMANTAANSSLTGAVMSSTTVCSMGGNFTVSVNDADNSQTLSSGDSVSISFNNCAQNTGTLNGSLSYAFTTLNGDFLANAYNASVTMGFGGFTVTGPQFSASANGSLTLSLNVTGPNSFTSSVSTPSLTVSGSYGGVTRTRTLSSYLATSTRTPDVTFSYLTTHTVSGSVTSSALGSQTISFATTTPVVVRGMDYYPSSGVMVITGANNGKLRLTAISNTQVTEELDANGDGTYEYGPVTVSWGTLY